MKNKKNMETESIFYAYFNSNGSKTVAPRKLPPRIITPPSGQLPPHHKVSLKKNYLKKNTPKEYNE